MSTDISGWVEVKRNDHWFAIVKILPIINRNYPMFNFLFGGRNGDYENAVAGNRRTPKDATEEVRGAGTDPADSWITLDEINAIDWDQKQDIITDDWKDLFQIMSILASQERTQDVRLVVWFF